MSGVPGDELGVGGTVENDSKQREDQSRGSTDNVGPTVDIDADLADSVVSDRSESPGILVPEDSELDPTISIVLPAMNEEKGIGECIYRAIKGLQEIGLPAEIIVSDDSTDRTPEIAEEWGARVVEPDGKGYGYAYKYGFQFARGQIVVMGDADTTYDFEELPKLIGPILRGEADLVMGSRFAGTIKPGAMPKLHQYVGNPLLTKFLNTFYDAGVSDAHSGFRALRRDALDELTLRSNGMEFASEMVMDASASGLEIEEVPITYHERRGEATLDSFRDGWRHVKFMLTNAPGYLFTFPSAVFVTLGVVTMGLSFLDLQPGGIPFGIHKMIIGSLLTIVGYQIGLLSVFTTISTEPIRTPDDWFTRWLESNFQFGYGATFGMILFVGGGVWYAVSIASMVLSSGYSVLPMVPSVMVAFTAIVIGVETIFASFHLSALQANGKGDDVTPGSSVDT